MRRQRSGEVKRLFKVTRSLLVMEPRVEARVTECLVGVKVTHIQLVMQAMEPGIPADCC